MLEQHIVDDNINAHIKLLTIMKKQIEKRFQKYMKELMADATQVNRKVLFVDNIYDKTGELTKVIIEFDDDDDSLTMNVARYKKTLELLGVSSIEDKTVEITVFDNVVGEEIYTPGSPYGNTMVSTVDTVSYITDIVKGGTTTDEE